MLSPLGKDENLFHSAISFSGTMFMALKVISDEEAAEKSYMEFYVNNCIKDAKLYDPTSLQCNQNPETLILEASRLSTPLSPGHKSHEKSNRKAHRLYNICQPIKVAAQGLLTNDNACIFYYSIYQPSLQFP